jgi:hypothetical protein
VSKPRVSTVYLGQFGEEHANRIAKELEEAGIVWWHKQSGRITQFLFAGDWGVRVFVDKTRLDQAREIAKRTES